MAGEREEPLDDTLLSLTVVNALEVAATRRDGRPLGTLDVLLGVLSIDLTWGWESVQIEAGGFVTEDDLARFTDPQPEAEGHWHNVPLSGTATRALAAAARLASDYKLLPMPGGALVLGLLADPNSAASRAMLANGSLDHSQLLALIQENVLDTQLEGLELGEAGALPESPPQNPRTGTAEVLARARQIEGREEAGSLALLVATLDSVEDPDLADLLGSMLLDLEQLAAFSRQFEYEDVPATEVVAAAADRFGEELDPAGLIVAAALRDAPRLRHALAPVRLAPPELAAQVAEWRLRRADGSGATTAAVMVVSVLSLLGSLATSVLLVASVFDSGAWWQLLLLVGVWSGYPKEGPWVGIAVAGVLGALVGWPVAVAQLASVLLEVLQAKVERDQLWTRTGVRISIRQQRHVVARLLTPRARRTQMLRQLARVQLAASFGR